MVAQKTSGHSPGISNLELCENKSEISENFENKVTPFHPNHKRSCYILVNSSFYICA
jgi:hypothetical protein